MSGSNQHHHQQQYLSPDDGMLTDTDVETTRSETPNIIKLPLQMMEPALLFRASPDPHHHTNNARRGGNTSNTNSSWLENPDRDSRDSRSSMGLGSEPGVQLDDLRSQQQHHNYNHNHNHNHNHHHHRSSTSKHASKQSTPPPLQSPVTIVGGVLQSVGDEESRPGSRGSHESEWNSTHPCFPHRNPYVPVDSPLYESTRVIRIARDFMVFGDLAPAYSNVFPDILEPHVTEDQFRVVVARVNEHLQEAFNPWNMWNWIDAVVGLLTLWLIEELVSTHCKRVLRRVELYLEERNRELEDSGQKAVFVPLRRTGYMNLDIQIPDPIPAPSEEGEDGPNTKFDMDNSDAGSIVAPLGSDVQSLQSHLRMGRTRLGSGGELSLGSMSGSLGQYSSR